MENCRLNDWFGAAGSRIVSRQVQVSFFCLSITSRLASISLSTPSDLRNKTVYFMHEGKGAEEVSTYIDLAPPYIMY
jgi:hypothetical protein